MPQNQQSTSRVLRGTLNMLIMHVVRTRASHGYGIMKQIEALSGDVLKLEEGSLYPALHRLEKDGLLDSNWRQSESNRRAKFYGLTEEGIRALESELENWNVVSGAVQKVIFGEIEATEETETTDGSGVS